MRPAAKHQPNTPLDAADKPKWTPRPLQGEILKDPSRFKTVVVHRRWGKTEMAIKWLIDVARECTLPDPRVYYLGTTMKGVKNVCWHMVKQLAPECKFDAWALSATFPNGAMLQLVSATNWQGHRGIYADALVVDETDLIPPSAFNAVFRPALSDRAGKAMFIGTPLGKGHLFQRFQNAEKSPNWKSWRYSCRDTDIIDPVELADLEATMPSADWRREFMVDFDAPTAGAYYANEVEALRVAGRIATVKRDASKPVTASWFFHKTDSVVITLWQHVGEDLHCFDAIWEQQTSMAQLARRLLKLPFSIERHFAPGSAREARGSRLSQARAEHLKMRTAPALDHMDRISLTKPVLARCRFDEEKCSDVIEGLRQYRTEYLELKRTQDIKPVLDWSFEHAGSVEAFTTAYNPRRSDWSTPIRYPGDPEPTGRRRRAA